MVTMTVGLVIAAVVLIGVILLAMRWRFASSEQHALRHYQHALDTLRTVSDRMESSRPVVEPRSQLQAPDGDEVETRAPKGAVAWEDGTGSQHARVTSRPGRAPLQAGLGASNAESGAAAPRHASSSRASQATAPQTRAPQARPPMRDVPGRGGHPSDDPTPADGLTRVEQSAHPGRNGEAHPALVFEEDGIVGEAAAAPGGAAFTGPRATRASRLALQRSSRPASRVPLVLGVLLVVVVIAVAAVLAA
jgi:hypothetical protein